MCVGYIGGVRIAAGTNEKYGADNDFYEFGLSLPLLRIQFHEWNEDLSWAYLTKRIVLLVVKMARHGMTYNYASHLSMQCTFTLRHAEVQRIEIFSN